MKNLLSIAFFCTIFFVSKTYAQSNLTWTFKGQTPKGFLKTGTVFNSIFTGFKSNEETTSFIQNLKSNKEIASCDVLSSTKNSCDLKIVMKQTHNKPYYINLASRIGVQFISANGNKKSIEELRKGNAK